MPRPKVHPSQRRRAVEACAFCRASKKRCSGTVPCTACKRRGIESQCSLKPNGSDRGKGARGVQEEVCRESHARMLLNLRGERVYIGEAASLSFLEVVRDTVASQIGPSQFTQNEKSDRMFETEPAIADNVAISLSDEDVVSYLATFEAATGGFLDVFARQELHPSNIANTSVMIAIAIGAQCKSHDAVAQVYFRQAQRQGFTTMLEDPDMDMVRLFLLMSFYLLGACRRNTAFMYLGIAARAAVSLGLHSEFGQSNPIRLKVWMSLCILDMLVSSILGRPPATSHLRSNITPLIQSLTTDQSTESIVASYQILSIVDDAVEKLYREGKASAASVSNFMSKMERWSASLPSGLRTSSDPKSAISNIHVSCLYYFAVTVVTRPILVASLNSQEPSTLATACLDAALLLIQTCADAKAAGILLGSMCIMKALVFAAGLIVGLSIFAKKDSDYETEATFRSAREVLDFLALQSPQAAHYSDILGLLDKSIMQRRGTVPRSKTRLVERIFTLNNRNENPPMQSGDSTDPFGWDVPTIPEENWDGFDLLQWDNFPFYSPRHA